MLSIIDLYAIIKAEVIFLPIPLDYHFRLFLGDDDSGALAHFHEVFEG